MAPRDWTLLVIAAAEGRSLEPVKLQKALFLLGKKLTLQELQTDSFYSFEAYDYGPFTSEVYSDAERLESDGLVTIARPPEARFKQYQATQAGLKRAAELKAKLHPSATDYLARLMKFIRSVGFNQLVNAIYKAYPEMRANSVFKQL